ncbi:MAG: hypothetical protein AAF513_06870 [Pseudomonadota bacterium]
MSDVIKLRTVQAWPEQVTHGHPIPGSRYTSREFAAQEWEGMWTKVWLLLGRESELPNPGGSKERDRQNRAGTVDRCLATKARITAGSTRDTGARATGGRSAQQQPHSG